MNLIQKLLMKVGVNLFTDYVPTWILKKVMGPEIDHIKFRNDLNAAARILARQ